MSQRETTNPNTVLTDEGAIVGVDLGKTVFQLCIADSRWRVVDAKRLSRPQFEQFFVNRNVARVVMEACATAHHWARWLQGLGIQVQLIPAQYVRAYVRRNKTDAADAAALLEAARCADIRPVRVKSVEQQALQTLHRTRAIWVATRTARINASCVVRRTSIPSANCASALDEQQQAEAIAVVQAATRIGCLDGFDGRSV